MTSPTSPGTALETARPPVWVRRPGRRTSVRGAVGSANLDAEKKLAAEAAAELVADGMKVGLGTGSTVAHLLPAIAARQLDGLRCVATSVATEEQARGLGIPVEPFDRLDRLDIAIDG